MEKFLNSVSCAVNVLSGVGGGYNDQEKKAAAEVLRVMFDLLVRMLSLAEVLSTKLPVPMGEPVDGHHA